MQGSSGFEAVTAVTVDQIGHVRVGQDATVAPDGHDELLRGKVVAIAQTPESSSSTTSYRVTIGLNDPSVELGNGSTGTVTIVTDGATAALAVPTSAVSTDGDQSTVTVYDEQGQVLLGRRKDVMLWAPPSGVIELGETPAQTLLREVRDAKNNERHACARRRGGEPAVSSGD